MRFQLQELTRGALARAAASCACVNLHACVLPRVRLPLLPGVAFYRRLGLEFEKIHDERLRLVFTQIDPLDPTRPFAFNVRVADADEAYTVDGVDPPVAGLDALVVQLNATNDFSVFVQMMRRKFCEAAAATRGR